MNERDPPASRAHAGPVGPRLAEDRRHRQHQQRPAVAVYGWVSLGLWMLAFVAFFVPEAIAVLALSRRYPGKAASTCGRARSSARRTAFSRAGATGPTTFSTCRCCWSTWPGIFAFAGGEARAPQLVDAKLFVAAVAFGWLALHYRGEHPRPGGRQMDSEHRRPERLSERRAGAARRRRPSRAAAPAAGCRSITGVSWEMATSFAVMCNALVGDRAGLDDGRRDSRSGARSGAGDGHRRRWSRLPRMCSSPAPCCMLVPVEQVGRHSGHHAGSRHRRRCRRGRLDGRAAGHGDGPGDRRRRLGVVRRLVADPVRRRVDQRAPPGARPRASTLTSRRTCALATWPCSPRSSRRSRCVGSSLREAYQVLLKAAVVIQLIPFIYLFLALAKTDGVSGWARGAGMVGLVTTASAWCVAFLPTADVTSVWTVRAEAGGGRRRADSPWGGICSGAPSAREVGRDVSPRVRGPGAVDGGRARRVGLCGRAAAATRRPHRDQRRRLHGEPAAAASRGRGDPRRHDRHRGLGGGTSARCAARRHR